MAMSYTFQSRTEYGKEYTVIRGTFGEWVCNCPGAPNCWHLSKVHGREEYLKMMVKKEELRKERTGYVDFRKLQEEQQQYVYSRTNRSL